MRIGILQPGYLPWLGFFEQLNRSDVFVIYDDVQYDKNGWRNRNKIKTATGTQWLTVPCHAGFNGKKLIKDIVIDNKKKWKKDHLLSIRYNYAKAPFFEKYIDVFKEAYSKKWEYLIELDMYFISRLAECLGIDDKKVVMSSSLEVGGDRMGRLINICKLFKADVFYEGAAGKEYIEETRFAEQGICVEYQDYEHPVYAQLYGGFVPYLSVVDLLFNHGDDSLRILAKQGFKEVHR